MKDDFDLNGFDVNDYVNPTQPLAVKGLKISTLKDALTRAKALPPLIPLLKEPLKPLWYDGELCCLFAPTNAGKTVLAMQIAFELAKCQRVLYFDFEMSERQLLKRYDGSNIPDNLCRAELDPDSYDGKDLSIDAVKQAIIEIGAKIVIIDNITYLCNNTEKGADAGTLMSQLCNLKRSVDGLSMLVVAHTPKRSKTAPITGNDLAGSSRLLNFFDSAFAINRATLNNKRYIKQIKSRAGEIVYDADNVLTMSIVDDFGGLMFEFDNTADENDLLIEVTTADRQQLINDAKQLRQQGLSCRAIADKLGVSVGSVHRWVKDVAKV